MSSEPITPIETVEHPMDEQLTAYYPSGNVVKVFGRYRGLYYHPEAFLVFVEALEHTLIAGENVPPHSTLVLDPRCVLVGELSGRLYEPRSNVKHMTRDMQKWLKQNQKWPQMALITTGDDHTWTVEPNDTLHSSDDNP